MEINVFIGYLGKDLELLLIYQNDIKKLGVTLMNYKNFFKYALETKMIISYIFTQTTFLMPALRMPNICPDPDGS